MKHSEMKHAVSSGGGRHRNIQQVFVCILLTVLATTLLHVVRAQSITPIVVAAAGTHYTSPSTQLSYTIGEPLVETLMQTGNILSQGFHQPMLLVTDISTLERTGHAIVVFPNPVSALVNIQTNYVEGNLQIRLLDMNGGLILSKNSGGHGLCQLDLTGLAAATYILQVVSEHEDISTIHRIIKLN